MLLLSTTLDTVARFTRDDFVKLLFKSIRENPHEENRIADLVWNNEKSISYGDHLCSLKIEHYRPGKTIAARYEKKSEDGAVWDTDYVFNYGESKLAIRLERSFSEDALKREGEFSPPYFIKYLIAAGVIEKDQDLEVSIHPIFLNEDNMSIVNNIRDGNSPYRLPVVLVTAVNHQEDLGDVYYLAHNLKGVAHVLLLKEEKYEDAGGNEDGETGAERKLSSPSCTAEIFYPKNALKSQSFTHNKDAISDALRIKVAGETIRFTNAQLMDEMLTWSGVNKAILTDAMSRLHEEAAKHEEAKRVAEEEAAQIKETIDQEVSKRKEEVEKEATAKADELQEAFYEDFSNLERQVEDLKKENAKLASENQGLMAKVYAQSSIPIICEGMEQDLYPGEIRDLIMTILETVAESGKVKGKRAVDILNDVLENNESNHSNIEKTENIYKLLKTYNRMEGPLRQELQRAGFEINEDGKHYKLWFYGDGRYATELAKTPSGGNRGAENAAHTARSVLYVVEK